MISEGFSSFSDSVTLWCGAGEAAKRGKLSRTGAVQSSTGEKMGRSPSVGVSGVHTWAGLAGTWSLTRAQPRCC